MRVIRCKNKKCKHNNGMFCVLEYVEINDNGNCSSFEERVEFRGGINIKCKCGCIIFLKFNELESTIRKHCPLCGCRILVRVDVKYM